MLSVINTVLIFIVVIVNIIMLFTLRDQVKKRMDTLSSEISKNAEIAREAMKKVESITIADLSEFERLKPEVKSLYKTHVAGNLLPRAMKKLNEDVLTPASIQLMEDSLKREVAMTDDELFNSSSAAPWASPTSTSQVMQNTQTYPFTLADLAEFESLNPNVKNLYKEHIVGNILPRAMNIINKDVLTPTAIKAIEDNLKREVAMTDEELFYDNNPTQSLIGPLNPTSTQR